MADTTEGRAALLRREYLAQTARLPWHELQAWYARGCVIWVDGELDLVELAVQLGLDNTALFEKLTAEGGVAPMSEQRALAWYEANPQVWAVVAPPWVLVQQRAEANAR
ncbi:MAG: DUF2288 family protein [Halieaceae bacterium]|nr:DUF2288 family protein [Halieaceae bacterium]MCP5205444.1 DUF2288 family protein [Pseudomonadales bacterium]